MSKREKIIIGVMILAVLAGGITILFPGTDQETGQTDSETVGETTQLITEIISGLPKENELDTDLYIIDRAADEWEKQPFVSTDWFSNSVKTESKDRTGTDNAAAAAALFHYTGYLASPRKTMAVINGKEYETGDTIEDSGFLLHNIAPTFIEVGEADGPSHIIKLEEELNTPAGNDA